MEIKYEDLTEKYPDTIVIRLRGMFYNAYDKSAFVLSELTSYKVKKANANAKCKCGFPTNALKKVKSILDNEKIDYIIFEGTAVVYEGHFEENRFSTVLSRYDFSSVINEIEHVEHREEKVKSNKLENKLEQKILVYECYGNDQVSAYLELQQKIDVELKSGNRVVTMSCNFDKREIAGKYVLSGIVIYERC
jgi:hypothetical protein